MNEIGNNLKRVRLLNNLSLREVGNLLNMSAPAISKYEKGEIIPNSQKLIEFANAYNVKTIEFLKIYQVPQMKFISFRKKQKLKGKNLELLKQVIQEEVSKYLEVTEMNKIDSNSKLKRYKCNSLEDAELAANNFREYINISNKQPISDLTNILENLGILIVYIKNKNNLFNDFDGLSEIVNNIPIIVLLDNIKDGARQRFTIAHELGHLLLDVNNIDEEKICNRFSSSLLMPKEAMINEFGHYRTNISFYELVALKNEYKVSYSALAYRLKDLNIITNNQYKSLSIFINKKIGKNDPNPITPERSYHFKRIVHKLESSEIITLSKACELLGETINEYNNEDNNYRH